MVRKVIYVYTASYYLLDPASRMAGGIILGTLSCF